MEYDAIIIGAGMSGLAAGIRLGYFDRKVLILEAHSVPGGLNSYYFRGGRCFDVGLHAVTNFADPSRKSAPMSKLLRQLRLRPHDFALCQQISSEVRFAGTSLVFTNDFDTLTREIQRVFPRERAGFESLVREIMDHDEVSLDAAPASAREVVGRHIANPMLADMILCPLMYYGNASEDDMDFSQFVIMFKSIFLEGFSRPRGGVKGILDRLVGHYENHGGEIRYRTRVESIAIRDGMARGVITAKGEFIAAKMIFSSAGAIETMRLTSGSVAAEQSKTGFADAAAGLNSAAEGTKIPGSESNGEIEPSTTGGAGGSAKEHAPGQLSFIEMILVLDVEPRELGFDRTIVFNNAGTEFHYRRPDDLVDLRSSVLCCPNNFDYEEPLEEGMIRVTHMANYDLWKGLDRDGYRHAKREWFQRCLENLEKTVPAVSAHVKASDMFTPLTVERYTGHVNGAVYGSPDKQRRGLTRFGNLYLTGTDQGFMGIVGTMLSGISMANLYGLMGR